MAILSNDRFLVQRSGASYRVDASAVSAMAEDTLQTATDRGNHTTNPIDIGGTTGSPNTTLSADGSADFASAKAGVFGQGSVYSRPNAGSAFYAYNGGSSSENAMIICSGPDGSSITAELKYNGGASFAGDVEPKTDGGSNLGSTTKRFANLYTQDMHFSNEGTEGNSVDGTTGDWTLQEGDENLYFINNKTGMKFRVVMEAV